VVGHRVTVPRWSMMVLYDQEEPAQASFLTGQDQAALRAENGLEGSDEGTDQEIAGRYAEAEAGSAAEMTGIATATIEDPTRGGGESASYRTIELIYERADGQYSGWNVWVWGTGCRDGHVELHSLEDGRAAAHIQVAPHVRRIGYIVRLNQWDAKDIEADRYIEVDLTRTVMQVLIHSGREEYLLLASDSRAV
jgi:pullulanase